MKSKKPLLFLIPLLLSCGQSSSSASQGISFDLIWDQKYEAKDFSYSLIKEAKVLKDNEFLETFDGTITKSSDYKYEFLGEEKIRYVDVSNGYCLTLPKETEIDNALSKSGTHFLSGSSSLRVSIETPSPYSRDAKGYSFYYNDWIVRYLNSEKYINENDFSFFSEPIKESKSVISGYEMSAFYIEVKNPGAIEFPYYHIGVLRPSSSFERFAILVYKSAKPETQAFLNYMDSFTFVKAQGTAKDYLPIQKRLENKKWNDVTKSYYKYLCEKEYPDWGFFNESMLNNDVDDYQEIYDMIVNGQNTLKSLFDCDFEIIPTYSHLAWHDIDFRFTSMHKDLAGGDGRNGKQVLQYTYQYTTTNNSVGIDTEESLRSPLIDVLRGKYDQKFHDLAKAIKEYNAPVLFRLNNEMNTDWTSYCGLYNLLDPELFKQSWIYLYEIFQEENVDNCIWIFNPFDDNWPSANWANFMSYYPGNEYVQMIGLTSYEFNNFEEGKDDGRKTFRVRFQNLFDVNKGIFSSLPYIVSEFGCAAGGETTGEAGRNEEYQASWVTTMFKDIVARKSYCSNIKAFIWFNKNDMSGGKILNYLKVSSELPLTVAAFKEGFAQLKEKKDAN